MKTFVTAAALALAAALPTVASAQSSTNQLNGLYFEAKINFARTKFVDTTTNTTYRFQDQGLGLTLGYNLDPTFAIEAGYDSLGKDLGVKLRGAHIGAVASYQLTPDLVGRVKAGVIKVQAKDGVGNKDDRTRLFLGAGLEYPVAPQFSLTGDYRYTRIDGEPLHTLSVGTKYTF